MVSAVETETQDLIPDEHFHDSFCQELHHEELQHEESQHDEFLYEELPHEGLPHENIQYEVLSLDDYGDDDAFNTSSNYDDIEMFVIRLYRYVLGRGSDEGGLQFWSSNLRNGRASGASIARDFFFSTEFINQRNSNSDFVEKLYLTLMNRSSEASGKAHWVNRLDAGWPREDIFAGFVNSAEFTGICNSYGITRGNYTAPPGGISRVFATRLYWTTLERAPDPDGLNFWHNSLKNGTRTGAVIAYDFIFSIEMLNRNLTDDHFVEILYKSMMGRDSDPGGKAFWLNRIRNGASRYSIFVEFVRSPEFGQICIDHNIIRGTAPQPANSIPGNTSLSKIWNSIVTAQFRGISNRPEHIAGIIGNLQAEAGSTLCPFQQQVSNQVGLGLMQWSYGRRTSLENFMWSNGISQDLFYEEMNKHITSYCRGPQNHPPAFLDRVLEVQIRFMFHELANTWERFYLDFVDFPMDRVGIAGARAYAELFCVLALRPGPGVGDINNIQDPGVEMALTASLFEGGPGNLNRISYSGLNTRRNNAEAVFRWYLTNHR